MNNFWGAPKLSRAILIYKSKVEFFVRGVNGFVLVSVFVRPTKLGAANNKVRYFNVFERKKIMSMTRTATL